MAKQNYWLMKTEPETFSWEDLVKTGWTHWDGVRNYQARNNLAAMKVGDLVLIYHSVSTKAIVGIGKITQEAYPDPTDETKKWVAVRVEPVQPFEEPVTLQQVKETAALADIPLVKQARLSVMPLPEADFNALLKMGKTKLKATV